MMQDVLGTMDEGFDEVEDSALVEAGFEALDERERLIVELRFFEGLTQSEIAAQVGISQMHVSRLLRRALQSMRGRLEDSTRGPVS
jgi:RNA polymerase sigma-B factor